MAELVLLSVEEQTRRARALQEHHDVWAQEQIAAGVDGPIPDDRPDPSDYNQHVPDMEADGEALDAFWDGVARIVSGA